MNTCQIYSKPQLYLTSLNALTLHMFSSHFHSMLSLSCLPIPDLQVSGLVSSHHPNHVPSLLRILNWFPFDSLIKTEFLQRHCQISSHISHYLLVRSDFSMLICESVPEQMLIVSVFVHVFSSAQNTVLLFFLPNPSFVLSNAPHSQAVTQIPLFS